MIRKLLSFYLFIMSSFFCYSQNNGNSRYHHYTTEDGLPSSTLYYVHQDVKGYIWFTSDAGVTRFDGYDFKNFTHNDGLPDNEILKLFEDSKGRIWLKAMRTEISYVYNDSIHLFNPNHQLDGLNLNNIYEDTAG